MADREDPILVLARNGDRAAFARLVEANYDMFYRVAYRHVGNRQDAEDVAQEVCVRLGKAIRSFRGDCSLSSWLYRLVVNASCDHHRRTRRAREARESFAAEPLSACPDEAANEAAERLWEAVRMLPEKTRQAVVLVYSEGLSHARAAEALDCSEATVSWHVHDAKKKLKAILAAPEGAIHA
jgi:RNA polymerase sigma factor, sigma-70 family